MNRIFTFLIKHVFILVFIVLETIALVFYFNANTFQKSKFFEFTTSFVSTTEAAVNYVSSYFSLTDVNNKLALENAELKTRLEAIQDNYEALLIDTIKQDYVDVDMRYISARVVSNSVYKFRNFIVIDKGKRDSIEVDMGVISSEGVVGIVQKVSDNFSIVMPLINTEQRISAKIESNNQLGSLIWTGKSHRYATMEDIPGHVLPVIGDKIVTSGYSAIFPEGVDIGKIHKIKGEESDPFREVLVELSVDFPAVEYVMVTKYKNKNELREVEEDVDKLSSDD